MVRTADALVGVWSRHERTSNLALGRHLTLVLECLDGHLFHDLASGGTWGVDPSDVVASTVAWGAEGTGAPLRRSRRKGADQVFLRWRASARRDDCPGSEV